MAEVDDLFNCFDEENDEKQPVAPVVFQEDGYVNKFKNVLIMKILVFFRNENDLSLKRVLEDDEEAGESSKKPRIESLLDDIK
jgi:hypothetical protein